MTSNANTSKRAGFRAMPVDAWPRQDAAAWAEALRSAGPLDRGGHASELRSATVKTMTILYGQVLNWLEMQNELDWETGPASRLTHDRLGSGLI
jgi:hypothetical protein